MRMSQEEKQKSHDRIVASAARLFRERGLEGAGVGDVMLDAGMTHGGFYKHFDSKDALVLSAIELAFAGFVRELEENDTREAYARYRARYLSEGHRTHPQIGCPVATLGLDVSRGSESLRALFGANVKRGFDAIARIMQGSASARRTAAIRDFSMLVGAMVIARASDDETASEVLAACNANARDI